MKYILLLSSLLFLLSSCFYDVEEELYKTNCEIDSTSYSIDVIPIITNYCIQCHSDAILLGGISLESHPQVKLYAENGKLLGSIRHDSGFSAMPQGLAKLSKCDIIKMETWVAAGALNN
ncbi:MAG: hypothetical protein WAT79_15630 [Saprospiraceae bacterium]